MIRRHLIIFSLIVSIAVFLPISVYGGGAGRSALPLSAAEAAPCTFTPASGITLPGGSLPCDGKLLANYIVALNVFFYRLAIVLAVLMITIGGFQWLSGMGNAGKIANAKETIEQAVIGLALAFTAYLIFSQIDARFVNLSTLQIETGELPYKCGILTDAESCQHPALSHGLACRWRCAEGLTSTPGSGCCIPVTGEERGQYYQIQGQFTFTDGNKAAVPFNEQLKCLSDKYGQSLRVTEAYPPSVRHADPKHDNGCAADVTLTENWKNLPPNEYCKEVDKVLAAAGSCRVYALNEYLSCEGTATTFRTGDHIHLESTGTCPRTVSGSYEQYHTK